MTESQPTSSPMEEKKIEYSELPMHKVRSMIKERGITAKNTDTKDELIRMLENGETIHKPRETQRMHNIEDTATTKTLPLLPDNFDNKIAHLLARGLKYEIDEETNSLTFSAVDPSNRAIIPTCINIDSIERHIIKAAEDAFGYGNSMAIDDRNNVQAARIESEKRERAFLEQEIKQRVLAELKGARN